MKNIFENAVVEIVEFSVNDIITTSSGDIYGEPDFEG